MPKVPRISGKQAVSAFEKAGFIHDRTVGSHFILVKEDVPHVLSIPVHGNQDVGIGLLRSLIRKAGMTVEAFLECL